MDKEEERRLLSRSIEKAEEMAASGMFKMQNGGCVKILKQLGTVVNKMGETNKVMKKLLLDEDTVESYNFLTGAAEMYMHEIQHNIGRPMDEEEINNTVKSAVALGVLVTRYPNTVSKLKEWAKANIPMYTKEEIIENSKKCLDLLDVHDGLSDIKDSLLKELGGDLGDIPPELHSLLKRLTGAGANIKVIRL